MRKKWFAAACITAGAALFLGGCGSSPPAAAEKPVPTASAAAEDERKAPQGRVLIAYFTWADNTHVADPSAVDTDASTSASVLAPGNTALMAGWIQQRTGGDLYSIRVREPYSSDYDACLDRAAKEKADNARPALTGTMPDLSAYDVIFLGFPNWWYTLPMPVMTFLESGDFAGKRIIPFCAHGTGGLASTIEDLRREAPASVIETPVGLYREEMRQGRPKVEAWLTGLGY